MTVTPHGQRHWERWCAWTKLIAYESCQLFPAYIVIAEIEPVSFSVCQQCLTKKQNSTRLMHKSVMLGSSNYTSADNHRTGLLILPYLRQLAVYVSKDFCTIVWMWKQIMNRYFLWTPSMQNQRPSGAPIHMHKKTNGHLEEKLQITDWKCDVQNNMT